jgi:hypothetical protein
MSEQVPICVVCDGCGWCEGSPAFTCPQCGGEGLDREFYKPTPSPAGAQGPMQLTREAFDAGWQAGRASVQPPDGWFNTFSSKEEAYQQWAQTHGGRK